MGLYLGRLIIGRIFASEIWGLIFGRAYFGGGGLIIRILRYDTKHCVTTQIRSSRMIEDGKTGFWSFKGAFFLVLVISVVTIASFQPFRSFQWFRSFRFSGLVSAFQLLVHALPSSQEQMCGSRKYPYPPPPPRMVNGNS